MSNRERWVVYPLLFFSILLAARDDINPPYVTKCEQLVCSKIFVKSPGGETLVSIGGNEAFDDGVVFVYGNGDVPAIQLGHNRPMKASGLFALDESNYPITASSRTHDRFPPGAFNWNKSPAPDSPPDSVGESVESPDAGDEQPASPASGELSGKNPTD